MICISRSNVWFKIARPPSNFGLGYFFHTVATNCTQVSQCNIVEITINVIHQQLTSKPCSKPAFITCGFFLVSCRFPAWFSRFDSFVLTLTSLTTTTVMCCVFSDIIYSTWPLIAGFTDGSHVVFSRWTFGKGQCKLGFFRYANKYQ